ncbi:MAG TPA: histidine kinase, partial [Flavobacteriales bacterium]|nr:histidine kinase [Flavobacteriales bacterium]
AIQERVDSMGLHTTLTNWGRILLVPDPDSAALLLERSIALKRRLVPNASLVVPYHNLAMAYKIQGRTDTALQIMERTLEMARAQGNPYFIIRNLSGVGEVLMAQGRYAEAKAPLDSALALAVRSGPLEEVDYVYEQVAQQREHVHDYEDAVHYLRLSMHLSDSMMNAAKEASMNEMRVRYETEKKERENQTLRASQEVSELRAERGMWLAAGGVMLAVAVAGFSWMLLQRSRERARHRESDLEQQALRLQMDPHFLFNALNTIPGLYASGDAAHADDHVGHLSKFLRVVLETSRKRTIALSQELDLVDNYLHICANRRSGSFTWEINVAPDVHVERVAVPPMLVQPLVENALDHGLSGVEQGGHVRIIVDRDGDDIRIAVQDNGMGRTAAAQRTAHRLGQSLGLELVRDRIRMIDRHARSTDPVIVRDERHADGTAAGTIVVLRLRSTDLRPRSASAGQHNGQQHVARSDR